MANEATIKVRLDDPIDFTCADGNGIEKGTLLKLSDPRTVEASTATGEVFAGIAAREKIANDGRTQIAVFRRGVFDLTLATGSTCTAGELVILSGANLIASINDYAGGVATAIASGYVVGKALETGSSGETIEVEVGTI